MSGKVLSLSVMVVFIIVGVQIGYAQPGFGQKWEKYSGNPLFSIIGDEGSWNDYYQKATGYLGHVLRDDTEYKLYLGGHDGARFRIGLWTSESLTSGWEEYDGNPILSVGTSGSWDFDRVANPTVIKDGDTYKMWYRGYDGNYHRLGYATSDDGITWTKDATNNPVFGHGSGWEHYGAAMPFFLKDADTYKMWYIGYPSTGPFRSMGYATSPEGIVWTRSENNPVLGRGSSGSWDSEWIGTPMVIKDEEQYLMWHCGGTATDNAQIGFAKSEDGINWIKDLRYNPCLNKGSTGDWDSASVIVLDVFKEDTTYNMLYLGWNETYVGVGLATLKKGAVSVENEVSELPSRFALSKNYPNPFNPNTTIEFSLPKNEKVTLTIYDIMGKEVETVLNQPMTAGNHTIQWSANSVPTGVYFVKMKSGDFIQTRKVMLLK